MVNLNRPKTFTSFSCLLILFHISIFLSFPSLISSFLNFFLPLTFKFFSYLFNSHFLVLSLNTLQPLPIYCVLNIK